MSEDNKVIEMDSTEQEKVKKAEELKRKLKDPEEQAKQLATGKLTLLTPMVVDGAEVTEVAYDFNKITGWDYADAMDSDNSNTNIFRITAKQALSLFGVAVSKETPNVSPTDVKERFGPGDAMNAVRIATTFFVASTRAANKRILNA